MARYELLELKELVERLKKVNIPEYQLERYLNLTDGSVNRVLSGKVMPRFDLYRKLAVFVQSPDQIKESEAFAKKKKAEGKPVVKQDTKAKVDQTKQFKMKGEK